MPRRVLIIHTGGTIGMTPGSKGKVPTTGFLEKEIARITELQHGNTPGFEILEYDPLLDSADMSPGDWVRIAHDIATHYEEYEGFLVLHGTDTMAYTASALSFLLRHLEKTVIVTGSQIPLASVRNDARATLITALLIAGRYRIPEVCLYFNNALYRGNRAQKVSAMGLDAFESPNYPPLGEIGIDIHIRWDRILKMPDETLHVYELQQPLVGAMRLFPGISPQTLRNLLQAPLQGMVLETYGVGNAPQDEKFLEPLRQASERGVVIVNCTQCLRGTVDMSQYATGQGLQSAGVVSGYDMTPTAALTKLYFLLSRGLLPADVRHFMQLSLRGELTPPNNAL